MVTIEKICVVDSAFENKKKRQKPLRSVATNHFDLVFESCGRNELEATLFDCFAVISDNLVWCT